MSAKYKDSPVVRKFLRFIEQLTNPPVTEQMQRMIEQLLSDEEEPLPSPTPAKAKRKRKPERRRRAALWRIIRPWKDLPPDEIEGRLAQYAVQHSGERVWQPNRRTLLRVIAEGEQGSFDNVT